MHKYWPIALASLAASNAQADFSTPLGRTGIPEVRVYGVHAVAPGNATVLAGTDRLWTFRFDGNPATPNARQDVLGAIGNSSRVLISDAGDGKGLWQIQPAVFSLFVPPPTNIGARYDFTLNADGWLVKIARGGVSGRVLLENGVRYAFSSNTILVLNDHGVTPAISQFATFTPCLGLSNCRTFTELPVAAVGGGALLVRQRSVVPADNLPVDWYVSEIIRVGFDGAIREIFPLTSSSTVSNLSTFELDRDGLLRALISEQNSQIAFNLRDVGTMQRESLRSFPCVFNSTVCEASNPIPVRGGNWMTIRNETGANPSTELVSYRLPAIPNQNPAQDIVWRTNLPVGTSELRSSCVSGASIVNSKRVSNDFNTVTTTHYVIDHRGDIQTESTQWLSADCGIADQLFVLRKPTAAATEAQWLNLQGAPISPAEPLSAIDNQPSSGVRLLVQADGQVYTAMQYSVLQTGFPHYLHAFSALGKPNLTGVVTSAQLSFTVGGARYGNYFLRTVNPTTAATMVEKMNLVTGIRTQFALCPVFALCNSNPITLTELPNGLLVSTIDDITNLVQSSVLDANGGLVSNWQSDSEIVETPSLPTGDVARFWTRNTSQLVTVFGVGPDLQVRQRFQIVVDPQSAIQLYPDGGLTASNNDTGQTRYYTGNGAQAWDRSDFNSGLSDGRGGFWTYQTNGSLRTQIIHRGPNGEQRQRGVTSLPGSFHITPEGDAVMMDTTRTLLLRFRAHRSGSISATARHVTSNAASDSGSITRVTSERLLRIEDVQTDTPFGRKKVLNSFDLPTPPAPHEFLFADSLE